VVIRAALAGRVPAISRRAGGDALIDERNLAGIGNTWKSESCLAASVDLWRRLAEVSDEQALEIVRFARQHILVSAREGFSAHPRAVYRRAPCSACEAHKHLKDLRNIQHLPWLASTGSTRRPFGSDTRFSPSWRL
jgi:formamidopyrimidine-DNA glycosylase